MKTLNEIMVSQIETAHPMDALDPDFDANYALEDLTTLYCEFMDEEVE
jgi:hypothetical protein